MKNITGGVRFFCYANELINAGDLVTIVSKKNGDPVVSKSATSRAVAIASCDMLPNQTGMCLGFGEIDNSIVPIQMNLSDFGELNSLINALNVCDLNTVQKHEISLGYDSTVLENEKVTFPSYNLDGVLVENGDITLSVGKWIVFFDLHSEQESFANIVKNNEIQYHWSQIGTMTRFCCSTACLLETTSSISVSILTENNTSYSSDSKCIFSWRPGTNYEVPPLDRTQVKKLK